VTSALQSAAFSSSLQSATEGGKLLDKLRKKSSLYRIIAESSTDATEMINSEIFEDTETLHDLAREALEAKDVSGDLSTINKYAEQRKSRKAEKALLGKRITKDRSIKFVEHEKLVNFMAPVMNTDQVEGRDDIVSNLFGVRAKADRPVKRIKKMSNHSNDIEIF